MLTIVATDRRAKDLTPEENQHLRQVVLKKLMPMYDGNQSAAAPAIGITQAGLSKIILSGDASFRTAKAIAKHLNLSIAEVLGWPMSEVRPSGEPSFGQDQKWIDADAEARRLYGDLLPRFAFDRALATKGGARPAVINAHTVYQLAKFWFESASDEDRIKAEREEILAKKAEEDAARSSHNRPSSATNNASPIPPPAKGSGPVDTAPSNKRNKHN